ncbi:MAG TPA: efflux RND transporter periplasmic adaptor subunit [Armatimonadota bacterium]|nr:efflux RND transporter periplasmic adaptor subunit [Armatimonadota bacterium]
MKRIAVIVALLVVLVAAFFLLGNSRSAEGPSQAAGVTAGGAKAAKEAAPKGPPATPVAAALVSTRTLQQVLEVNGSLKTDDDVQIGSRIAGKVIRVNAKEGDRVQRGQVLVQLDPRELMAQIARSRGLLAGARAKLSTANNQANFKDTTARSDFERAKANLASAKVKVQQAETNAKLIDVETRTRVQTAEANLSAAKQRLAIARESTRRQELRQAQLAVDQAQAQAQQARVDADNARQYFERRQNLYKQDAIAKEEVDEAERRYKGMASNVQVADAAVAVAQQKLDLAKEGSRQEEVRVAEEQVRAAEQALEQAKSDQRKRQVAQDDIEAARAAQQQAEAAVRAAEAGLVQPRLSRDEIDNARAQVQQALADIQFYQTQLSDLTIRAPVSGVVSSRSVNVGEMVTVGSKLMDLVALDTVYLEAVVPELEIGLVRAGVPAQVTVDAMPGKTFSGTVREVIPVADRTSRSFRVRVAVLGSGGRLPANGYARAKLAVGTHPGAVVVRKDAIHTEAGDTFVWLIAPGENGLVAKRQMIQVGLVDKSDAEVLSGLQPGQQVIAAGSPAIIENSPVSIAKQ